MSRPPVLETSLIYVSFTKKLPWLCTLLPSFSSVGATHLPLVVVVWTLNH